LKRILVVSFLLTGCGEKSSDRSEGLLPDFPGDDAYAANYFVQDTSCQTGAGVESVASASFFEYDGAESVARKTDFPGVKSVTALSSALVTNTMYGLHQRSQCEYNGSGIQCGENATLVRAATFLKVCQSQASYERTSVEGVALSALNNLERAYHFYQSLQHRNPALMRTALLVLPKVERAISIVAEGQHNSGAVVNKVTTDNLAYTPEFVGEPAFVVYPKGKSVVEDGLWVNLNLWEVPFALAHEFGHHVMRTHSGVIKGIGKFDRSVGQSGDMGSQSTTIIPDYWRRSTNHNSKGLTTAKSMAFTSSLQREVTPSDLWGAVNEGFADLFGFYATGAQSGGLKNVDCFRSSREVTAPQFADGTAKVISSSVIQSFLSTSVESAPEECDAPYFQSIHSIGAVVAHGIDKMIVASGVDDAQGRADVVLLWGARLRELVSREAANEIDLGDLVGAVLPVLSANATRTAAEQRSKSLSGAVCDAARQVFPVFAESWFSSGGYTCR